jgi:hypothetical protein
VLDLRDFLTRFRPVGTPGAAMARGVPADRVAEREAELAPVLALLAETQQDAARVRREADEQAEQRRLRAREQADAIMTDARRRAEAERAAAAARVSTLASDERRRAEITAAQRAARVRAIAAQRMPGMLDRALAPVLAALEPARSALGESSAVRDHVDHP